MNNSVLKPLMGIIIILVLADLLVLGGIQGSLQFHGMPLFALAAAVPFLLHWLLFIPAYIYQTEHYFDLTGSLSFLAAIALVVALSPELGSRAILLGILVSIWAIRLGSFLFLRVKRVGQDSRFTELKTRFTRYLYTWTLGGFWVFATVAAGLAAMTSAQNTAIDSMAYVGLAVWLLGFAIEVIADKQKNAFRANTDNSGKFISSGLWAWSRHPNYFGEILLWFGIAIIALPALSGWQYATMISPVFVALLIIRVSGVKLLEQSADKKWGDNPDYQRYKENTPSLILMPPKSNG